MFTLVYNWLLEYFFSGIDTLPAVVQGIVPELCTLMSLAGTFLLLLLPLWLLWKLGTVVFSFGRWR